MIVLVLAPVWFRPFVVFSIDPTAWLNIHTQWPGSAGQWWNWRRIWRIASATTSGLTMGPATKVRWRSRFGAGDAYNALAWCSCRCRMLDNRVAPTGTTRSGVYDVADRVLATRCLCARRFAGAGYPRLCCLPWRLPQAPGTSTLGGWDDEGPELNCRFVYIPPFSALFSQT